MKKFASKNGGNYPKKSHIQCHFNYKSNNSVTQFFNSLEEKGILSWLDKAKKFYTIKVDECCEDLSQVRQIYVEGLVSAGVLKEAVNEREEIEIAKAMLNQNKEYFALKVYGDSMNGDYIIDGDIVVLEETTETPFGTIAAVQVNGEATLKRIFKKGKDIELVASNPSYKPILVTNDPTFKVLGKLHTVIRQLRG